MKINWLFANVTAVGAPDRAEHATHFLGDFDWAIFLANSGRICGRGATL